MPPILQFSNPWTPINLSLVVLVVCTVEMGNLEYISHPAGVVFGRGSINTLLERRLAFVNLDATYAFHSPASPTDGIVNEVPADKWWASPVMIKSMQLSRWQRAQWSLDRRWLPVYHWKQRYHESGEGPQWLVSILPHTVLQWPIPKAKWPQFLG